MLQPAPNQIYTAPNFGGWIMSNVGVVRYDGKARAYYVDLPASVTGKREKIYSIPVFGGNLMVCKTEDMGKYLRRLINDQITQGIFRAERFKRKKPLHLKAYAQEWLARQIHLGVATQKDYAGYIKNYITPLLGKVFIEDITEKTLEDFLKDLGHRAPKTRYNVVGCIMKILRDAKRWGDIPTCPEKPVVRGANVVIKPEMAYLDPATQREVLEEIPTEHRVIWMFLMLSGCRTSEARALRWQDIKWTRNEVMLAVTFDRGENLCTVKQKRIEPIPMTEGLRFVLKSIPRNLEQSYVFINPDTGNRYTHNFTRIWRAACIKALGYYVRPYHATRHSYAFQKINAGMPLPILQRLMRHTDARTTKRYYDMAGGTLKSAAEMGENILTLEMKSGSKTSVEQNGDKNTL